MSAGLSPRVHAESVPSSVAKMNVAANLVPGTRKAADGFQTMPVGAAGVIFGGLFGSTVWLALLGMMFPGSGIAT